MWCDCVLAGCNNRRTGCSARRDTIFDFVDHTANGVAKFLDHVLISWQRVALGVIKDVRCIWIADVVERNISMKIRVQ